MKKNRALGCLVALSLYLPLVAGADIRVLGTLSVEPAPEWGRKATDLTIAREWWFAGDRMAFVTQDWRYVFDKSRGRILVINTTDRYFVEAGMTVDSRKLVDPGYVRALGRFRANGTVERSPKKKTVLGRECAGTVISEWLVDDNQHFFDRDRTVYATTDVPFDWRLSRDLAAWMLSFFNPEMTYFGGMRSIEGFPLAETDVYVRNTRRTAYGTEVTDIREATPAGGFYDIPEGFSRREKLSQRDLLAMRQILYLVYYF
jgi:hypothetical protein